MDSPVICGNWLKCKREIFEFAGNLSIYNLFLISDSRHREVLQKRECWDFDKILASRTLAEFDSCFTSPQFGYANVQEYYKDAVITHRLNRLSLPVFSLNSTDDPIQPGEREFL